MKGKNSKKENTSDNDWFAKPIESRLSDAIVNGIDKYIVADVKEFHELTSLDPINIIEGPLLAAMGIVGDLFGSGKMFLPQVTGTWFYFSLVQPIVFYHVHAIDLCKFILMNK